MLFWKRADKPHNELLPGEFWLLSGDFRMDEAVSGMVGFYGLPGGWGSLTALPEQEKRLEPFHRIVLHTVEQIGSEHQVALTISDHYEDVYLDCSILEKGTPLSFDAVSTPKKTALLNLHVDWDHLVLIIQTAPDYPAEKLKAALADACRLEGWTFSEAKEQA